MNNKLIVMKKTLEKSCLVLFLIFCFFYHSQAQVTWCDDYGDGICYEDILNGRFANESTRVVANIKEFDDNDEVHIECVVIGYIYLGAISVCLEYDPDVVYPIDGTGGNEIVTNLNAPVNMGNFLWINPELPGGVNRWRAPSTTGQVNPKQMLGKKHWIFIKSAQLDDNYKLKIENNGEMVSMYKVFFRKKEGKTLTNETFNYYNRTGAPVTYNEIVHGTTIIRSTGETATNLFVNPELFTCRVPSIVTTLDATVDGANVMLNGVVNRDGVSGIPRDNHIDWDSILETGFIYSKNNVTLTMGEYSNTIRVNDMEYDFPTHFEADCSFTLGGLKFYMLPTKNLSDETVINMREEITGLDVEETYYIYTYMKYRFQTSGAYTFLGKRTECTTTDDTNLFIHEKTTDDYTLTIYPNPSSRGNIITLLLTLPGNEKPDAVAYIFDIYGKKVGEYGLSDFETPITLTVGSGVYTVRVITKCNKQMVGKIVVK
jgi:hypothetical protein